LPAGSIVQLNSVQRSLSVHVSYLVFGIHIFFYCHLSENPPSSLLFFFLVFTFTVVFYVSVVFPPKAIERQNPTLFGFFFVVLCCAVVIPLGTPLLLFARLPPLPSPSCSAFLQYFDDLALIFFSSPCPRVFPPYVPLSYCVPSVCCWLLCFARSLSPPGSLFSGRIRDPLFPEIFPCVCLVPFLSVFGHPMRLVPEV